MALHCKPDSGPTRRHDLIYVSPVAWRSLLTARADLAAAPLVADSLLADSLLADSLLESWVDNGWPLIGRRAMPHEARGVALGLPLPPFAGKRRLSFLIRPEDIVSTAPPPTLGFASRVAPRAWRPTLDALDALGSRHGMEARVFGSLAWRALTGLDYLTGRSDLDLLLHVHRDTDLLRLAADLALIEALAPMRLDGEFVRGDGAAVNWREFHAGAREILVKTVGGVALLDTTQFLSGTMPS